MTKRLGRRLWMGVAGMALLAGGAAAKGPTLTLETISNRADLVSGGDVLVRVSGDATLTANGQAVALQADPEGKGKLALVTGLKDGANTLAATAGGKTVRLTVTNHPNGGPLFSGPQIQPWTCKPGATDAQCNRPTTISWSYLPNGSREFKAYDPAKPANDVAMATTADGKRVPFVVRVETLTQDRSGVSVATLYDPSRPWTPFTPQAQWNRSVLVLQGAGCGTGYSEKDAPSPLNERALGKGFAVLTVALLHNTINCNPVVQAEAALMAKEHVIETYGPIDLFFGQGSSGGAISQIMDQNAYPGLYDGLLLNHLFIDSDASRKAAYDCRLIYDAWSKPGAPAWTDAQKAAVVGQLSGCNSSPTRFEIYHPGIGTGCDVPKDQKFDAKTNPKGVRCTLQDYEVNVVGRRPDGRANSRIDNEGVQYGLKALLDGVISPQQFLQLNEAVGGHDIDFNRTATRTAADRAGLKALYQSGLNNMANNLADTPIIETRLNVTDFHQPFNAVMVRARLERAQGHHDNYILWKSMSAREASFQDAAFDTMVQWMHAIKADTRDVPKARKVIDNRPAAARDRCVLNGADQPLTSCPRPEPLARVLAGAPDTNDTGKCVLRALNRSAYGKVSFSDAEWARLKAVYPKGVCDYSKPLVDIAMTRPWLTYAGGKGVPLPPPPRAR